MKKFIPAAVAVLLGIAAIVGAVIYKTRAADC